MRLRAAGTLAWLIDLFMPTTHTALQTVITTTIGTSASGCTKTTKTTKGGSLLDCDQVNEMSVTRFSCSPPSKNMFKMCRKARQTSLDHHRSGPLHRPTRIDAPTPSPLSDLREEGEREEDRGGSCRAFFIHRPRRREKGR